MSIYLIVTKNKLFRNYFTLSFQNHTTKADNRWETNPDIMFVPKFVKSFN